MHNLDDILSQVQEIETTSIQKKKTFEADPRLLQFKKNNKYTFRFLPNIKDKTKHFVIFEDIGFKSLLDNTTYVFGGRSPTEAGHKKDLWKDAQWATFSKAREKGDEEAKKNSYRLFPNRKQLANIYLIAVEGDDEKAKEKIGQNLYIAYNARLDKDGNPTSDIHKKVHAALSGDKVKKIGARAFDLTEKGKSFTVNVKTKGVFPDYSDSEFEDAEDIGLTSEQITKIYDNVHDLTEFVPEVKSDEEIKKLLNEHYYCLSASLEDDLDTDTSDYQDKDDTDIDLGDSTDKDSGDADDLDDILKKLA